MDSQNTINDRIKIIIDTFFDGNISAMAKDSLIKRTTMNNIIGENRVSPGYDVIIKIVDNPSLDISPEWLITGSGEMLKSQNNNNAKLISSYIKEDLIAVPFVPHTAMASFVESLYDTTYELDVYNILPEPGENLVDGTYKVFEIGGESMYPTLSSGTKILCQEINMGEWEYASGVIVTVYGKTLTVKRILKNCLFRDNILTLKADNHKFGQVDIERKEIRGMWKAIRIVSQKII